MKKKRNSNYQNIGSVISSGVEVKGEINSKESIRVDGHIEGTMNILGDFILGEKGYVKGEIKTENMILAGKVEGNMSVKNRLEIMSSGVLLGDINCTTLVIEEGGVLEGNSKMNKAKEKSEIGKIADIKKNKA